jgi:acyl carrier protein
VNQPDLRETVLAVLGEIAPEAELGELAPDAVLRDELDLDSMDYLNFVIGLHKRLGVDIPEADYPKLSTLDGAIAYLQTKQA